MTPRGIGCAVAGLTLFAAILVGGFFFNLDLVRQQAGCPERLRWSERTYLAVGPLTDEPQPGGSPAAEPVRLGTTLVGLTGRDLYGPAGTEELPPPDQRPDDIALDCGDGRYRSYQVES